MTEVLNEERLQYLVDEKGIKTAVILPIQEWKYLLAWYQQSEVYQEWKAGIKDAFREVRAVEAGDEVGQTLDQLFEELAHED